LRDVREDLVHAEQLPVWSGGAALVFALRAAALRQGLSMTRTVLAGVRGALETAAGAYQTAEDHADYYIGFWRNRPAGLPLAVEEIFARLVNAYLLGVGTSYNEQLGGHHRSPHRWRGRPRPA